MLPLPLGSLPLAGCLLLCLLLQQGFELPKSARLAYLLLASLALVCHCHPPARHQSLRRQPRTEPYVVAGLLTTRTAGCLLALAACWPTG
jgi:hypothetical protein